MNWTQIGATIGSVLLGIGVVVKFIDKFMPSITKYVGVAHQAIGLVDDLLEAVKDHVLTPEEIAKLEADVTALKNSLK